jgi:pilus assembly protein CpaF
MADHARVVVARPDFAENWMFFIRKLDNIPEVSLQQLVTGGHAEIPVELLKWLMKGCQVTAVTGMQGCGKTTLLTAMVGEIPEEYTIRVLELAFELHLRERYQNRNIVTFRETAGMMEHGGIGGQEALEVQKKTDGAVSIIGEVVSAKVASWMIESGQTGSLFTIFTHHAKSTRSLLLSLRNSLLKEGSFQSERVALEQVTEVVRFDVHLHMNREGQRYIERISEIVPDTESPEGYRIVELVRFDGERYVKLHTISETTRAEMVKWLTKEEKEAFFNVDI